MAEKEQMLELGILLLRVVISMNPRHDCLEKRRCQRPDAFNPMDTHKLLEYPWPQNRLDRILVPLDADNLQAERPDVRV